MVAVYIDPDASSGGDGSIGSPWNNPYQLVTQPWDEAYFKRDTISLVPSKINLNGLNNKTIGDYGSGAKPEIRSYKTFADNTGWVEVDPADGKTPASGTNLWSYEFPYNFWNAPGFVNFGLLGVYGIHKFYWNIEAENGEEVIEGDNVPAAYGEYDYRRGTDATDKPRLVVYSVGNPIDFYGQIYYQLGNDPAFLIRNCDNFQVHNLAARYCYDLLKVQGESGGVGVTNFWASGLEGRDSYDLINIHGDLSVGVPQWVDGFVIEGCLAQDMLCRAFNPHDYIKNGVIRNNRVVTAGLVESDGAFYFGNCFAPVGEEIHVFKNHIEDMKFGRFWPHDGGSIMTDSNSANIWSYQNFLTDSHAGFKSNSGESGCRIFSNVTVDVDQPFMESDTGEFDSADTYICNNTFLNCEMYKHYTRVSPKSSRGAIQFETNVAVPNGQFTVMNNIITCVGSQTNGIMTKDLIADAGNMTESNNIIVNAAWPNAELVNGTGVEVAKAVTDKIESPALSSDYRLSMSSSAFRAGADWWTSAGVPLPQDYYGNPLKANVDIGAVQYDFYKTSTRKV